MSAHPFRIVIPARYASSRLPAKPLADIAGKPMIVRVAERVAGCGAAELCIATDHAEVARVVEAAGFRAVMTRADHPSGTDRLGEVVAAMGWQDDDIVVNVQGDEPLIDPAIVRKVADSLASDRDASIATAAHPIHDIEEFMNPAVVKVVCDAHQRALYFSRAPMPWPRDAFGRNPPSSGAMPGGVQALRHVGLYAYRVSFLRRYAGLAPSPLEGIEMLEQLRALWHGYRICVDVLDTAPAAGVDTPEDLERVRRIFEAGNEA